MSPTAWFATVKQRLSCKDTKKLHKPQPAHEPKDEEQYMSEPSQCRWMFHDLSTIYEDAEPLLGVMAASKGASIISSGTKDNDWSLLDNPAVLQLCSASNIFNDMEDDESNDPRASSKIVIDDATSAVYQQQGSVSSSITLDSVVPGRHDLLTILKLTEDDLAWHSAALEHAHDQLHFLRGENLARFEETQELTAQVHGLERVRGWGKKALKREITTLTDDLFELDLRLTMQVHRLRELEESLWEWKEYALRLEGQIA